MHLNADLRASKYDGLLASFYDADHGWRDYGRQSDFVFSLFHASKKPFKIADLCCGTGSHALRLAGKGLAIEGFDVSEELLNIAKRKLKGKKIRARFMKRDIFSTGFQRPFREKFDGAIFLGWTLAMEPLFRRFSEVLKSAWEILKPGGLFVFDAPIGFHFNPSQKEPIQYEVSEDLKGTLRMGERPDFKKGSCTFSYDWQISKRSRNGRFTNLRLRAKEVLRILKPEDIFSRVASFGNDFELVGRCRDYRMDRPYRDGDANLVTVLRKHVPRH